MMKSSFILPAVIIGLVVVAIAGYFMFQPKTVLVSEDKMATESMTKEDSMMKMDPQATAEAMMDQKMSDESMDKMDMMSNTGYLSFSSDVLAKTAANKRVLFFYASWCPTCNAADANFKANLDKLPQDLALIKVNYADPETDATEKELAKKYGITYQHTFVQIDADGKELAKWNGGQINELLAKIK